MIGQLRRKYVSAVAAESGVVAFVKWWAIGLVLQTILIVPLIPLAFVGMAAPESARPLVGGAAFAAGFLCLRVFLFGVPCADVGALKRRGTRGLWLAGGVVFGMYALGLAAALSPEKA